jgi:hypothetical protein
MAAGAGAGAGPGSALEHEMRALRHEVTALRAHLGMKTGGAGGGAGRYAWLRHLVKGLETDPRLQYKVHFWGSAYWLVNIPVVLVLYFFAPSKILLLITLVYSVYANFATDYGGMSAAMASFGPAALPEIPLETVKGIPAKET